MFFRKAHTARWSYVPRSPQGSMVKVSAEREERRRRQAELAEKLTASGALDEVFAELDAGAALTGDAGVLGAMLKAALERVWTRS